MKSSKNPLLLFTLCLMWLSSQRSWGQCPGLFQVTHASGTQTVTCSEVTVSLEGEGVTDTHPEVCFDGPYWIYGPTSSLTFSFSPPVSGLQVDLQTLNVWEEAIFEVNGSFYPITSPPGTCTDAVIISPPGTLRCLVPGGMGCTVKDLYIAGPIYSLKITASWYDPDPVFIPGGFGTSVYICCSVCDADAGQIIADRLDKCVDETASVPPAQQTVLAPNDLLQYVLFTDVADTLGSVVAVSNTPSFAFNPATMSLGTTYYIAAMAGDGLNGNVDPDDRCLVFSNAIEVAWWGHPTVGFTSDATCLVPGNCYEITALFTGTPPYQLSGEALSGNNSVTNFFADFFSDGSLSICLPSNTPVGPITVVATGLSDAHCVCD